MNVERISNEKSTRICILMTELSESKMAASLGGLAGLMAGWLVER
jgi:hypothetical protein